MQRLSEQFDPRHVAQVADWKGAAQKWAAAGIDPRLLRTILDDARGRRLAYEHYLRALTDTRHARARFHQDTRNFDHIIAQARPLITLLKQFDYVVFDLGRLVEMAIDEIGARLAMENPDAVTVDGRRPGTARHRPGEPWLYPPVLALWSVFRRHGYGINATKRAIHEALALDGHDDVVSVHKINRIIKRTPRTQLEALASSQPKPRKRRQSRSK